MANDYFLISEKEELKKEFSGAIDVIIRQSMYDCIQALEEKAKAGHLSENERQELRNLHRIVKKS